MAERRPPLRMTALVLASVGGVVLAHGLDYLLVIRSPAQRASELAETGHGWWPSVVGAALGAAALALATAWAVGARRAAVRRAADSAAVPLVRDLTWMAVWQAGVFSALEVLERVAAHRSPAELLHGPLFPVGLLLQVVVAVLVVLALRGLERAGAVVAGAFLRVRPARRGRRPVLRPGPIAVAAGGMAPGRHVARGPPLSVAA
jgi:hypothetical protein